MHLQTKALVLRETAYKESDKILTLLTQEAGRLTAAGAALLPFTGTVRPGGPLSCCLLGLAVVLLLLGSAG